MLPVAEFKKPRRKNNKLLLKILQNCLKEIFICLTNRHFGDGLSLSSAS